MNTLKLSTALAVGLLSAAAASATNVTLDLSAASGAYGAQVNNLYNGGTDSAGASGTNYGISFTGSVLEIPSSDALGTYFTGGPTNTAFYVNPGTTTTPDVAGVMNVASGFSGALGLIYSSDTNPTTVSIWSGLNDTGTLLSTFTLSANNLAWSTVSQSFAGVAESVDFGSNAGNTLYTDISVSTVPLPASGLLMSFGVAGLALFGARRRAA